MVRTGRERRTAQGRGRPGHFFFFSFSLFFPRISYRKLGIISKVPYLTYHTSSKVMISYDKRVAVLPNYFSFFLLGLALPSFSGLAILSLGFGPSLSFVLTLEEVNCGITREALTLKVFFYIMFCLMNVCSVSVHNVFTTNEL